MRARLFADRSSLRCAIAEVIALRWLVYPPPVAPIPCDQLCRGLAFAALLTEEPASRRALLFSARRP